MVIRIFIGVATWAALLAVHSEAAPGKGGDRTAEFPANQWVSLDGVLKVELMTGAEGRYRFMNWYGGVALRSNTGEVIALDGFVGHDSEDARLDGETVGATSIYSNSLYGVDPTASVMRQYDVCRWLRRTGGGVKRALPDGTETTGQWLEAASNRRRPTPMPRHVYGCLVYVPPTDEVHLYRGAARGAPQEMNIHWAYSFDHRRWRIVEADEAKLPPAIRGSAYENKMGYLADADGGEGSLYFFYAQCKGPTWAFDLATERWRATSNQPIPVNIWSASMVADPVRRRFLLVGGEVAKTMELWAYEADAGCFVRVEPAEGSALPPHRSNPGIAWLGGAELFFLYGGHGRYDHWLFDPRTRRWVELTSIPSPPKGEPKAKSTRPAQEWCYLQYDTKRRLLILARHVQRNGPHWLAMRLDLDALPEWKALSRFSN